MTSREHILSSIKNVELLPVPLPEMPQQHLAARLENFVLCATTNGSDVIQIDSLERLSSILTERFQGRSIASSIIPSNIHVDVHTPIEVIEKVDVAVLSANFGVAENGALLLKEESMMNRSLPFLCEHLVLVLPENKLCYDMHEACASVPGDDYVVFISGPSKTADIEQSLVIGAHGPKTLTVALLR